MKTNSLGELEQRIMDILWKYQHCSARDILAKLKRNRKIAYTTVATILQRLYEKGLLKRTPSSKAYVYKPAYSKDAFLTRITHQIIRNLVSNFGTSAIAHFAQELENITPSKKQKLIKILKLN